MTPDRRHDRGAVGGAEVLPFALVLTVATSLLFAHAWGIVAAELAVEQAATAAGRAYVGASETEDAPSAARLAARESFEGSGRDPDRLAVQSELTAYVRCGIVEHRTTTEVRGLRLPLVGTLGPPVTVHGHHRIVLDRFASGLPGEADCG